MDRETKKRKLEDEDGSEEKQMEEFLALARSTKDFRDKLRNYGGRMLKKEEDGKTDQEKTTVGIWNPIFEPQDFMEVRKSRKGRWDKSSIPAGPSDPIRIETERASLPGTGSGAKEVRESENLDLKLSL